MKTKVMIIEDNPCKFFTMKAVIEAALKVEVTVNEVQTSRELADAAAAANPDVVLFRPEGGVAELLESLKKRRINRRNTEVTILVAEEIDEDIARRLQSYMAGMPKLRMARAA
jgi:DNA-binding NarL/FixJ family response regulator